MNWLAVSLPLALVLQSCVVQTEHLSSCEPGSFVFCYSGPEGTLGIGRCAAGVRQCGSDGKFAETCEGEILPVAEDCSTVDDDDCDGVPNQTEAGCGCAPGSSTPCYSGPSGTENIGLCTAGIKTCNADGKWGACIGDVTPTLEHCYTAADENCDGYGACDGKATWSRSFGGTADQLGYRVVADSEGNIIVAGIFSGTLDFGGTTAPLTAEGSKNAFVAKLDPTGSAIWSNRFGGNDNGIDVTVDRNGNIVLVGKFDGTIDLGGGPLDSAGSSDAFVAKLDPAGGHLWSSRFGGPNTDWAEGVSVDAEGNVFAVGGFKDTISFGALGLQSSGGWDVFVTKFKATNGDPLWARAIGNDGDSERAYDVATDDFGNVLITGQVNGSTINFGGGDVPLAGGYDGFVLKLDSGGSYLWARVFGDASDQAGSGIAVDSSGDVVLTGSLYGSFSFGGSTLTSNGLADVFLTKFNAAGDHIWSKAFGDAANQEARGVAVDATGNVIVSGQNNGAIDFGNGISSSMGAADIFLAKFDATGNHLWQRSFGGSGNDVAWRVGVDPLGAVINTGYFATPSITIDGQSLGNAGGIDVFVAKLRP